MVNPTQSQTEANEVTTTANANNQNISASTQALAIEPIENHEGSSKRKATSEPMESPTNHKCPALEQVEPIKLEGEKKWKNILSDWINQASLEEKDARETAAIRITACIENNENNENILDLSKLDLTSLPPILHLCKNLEEFNCQENELTEIDLSQFPNLVTLDCSENKLTEIDLSQLDNLAVLDCSANELTELNLEKCPKLLDFVCSTNNIEKLDFSHCKKIIELNCAENLLAELDIKHCHALEQLNCSLNKLSSLNVSGLKKLETIYCEFNGLNELNIDECNLLTDIVCYSNPDLNLLDCIDHLMQAEMLMNIECEETATTWAELSNALETHPNFEDMFIDIRPDFERNQDINAPQNTHTASVHQSASENALFLKNRNENIDIKKTFSLITAWAEQLETSSSLEPILNNGIPNEAYKNAAAKRFIDSPIHLQHKDAISQVTVQEFMALIWQASQDPAQREKGCEEKEAVHAFTNALYEIQRGYNIDAKNLDNNETDQPICAGGTFNKLSEKIVGVIKEMHFNFITKDTFIKKFQAEVQEKVNSLCEQDPALKESIIKNNASLTEEIWITMKDSIKSNLLTHFDTVEEIAGQKLDIVFDEVAQQIEYLPIIFSKK